MADETVRLVLDVTGVQDIEALKKEMLALTTAMGATDASLGKVTTAATTTAQAVGQTTQAATTAAPAVAAVGTAATTTAQAVIQVGQASFQATTAMAGAASAAVQTTVSVTQAGQAASQTAGQLNNLGNAAQNAAGGGGGGAGGVANMLQGRGLMGLSYALQDLYQGGFSAILNNIPMLATGFGLTAGTAGTLAIAGLVVNETFKAMAPLFEDTEGKLNTLSEAWKDFAEGIGAAKTDLELTEIAVKKLAESMGSNWITSLDTVNDKFKEFLKLAKEANELRKEQEKEQADRKSGENLLNDMGGDKDRGQQYKEYIQGQGEDNARAKQDALAKDMREKARQEIIEDQVSAEEKSGMYAGNAEYREYQKSIRRKQLDKTVSTEDEEVIDRSKSMAAGTMAAAARGDKKALAQIAAADKEFAEYEAEVAADAEAQKVHAKWREKRLEREKREMEENKEQERLAGIGPPEQAFRNNVAAQRQAEEREAERVAQKKIIDAKVEKEKNEALEEGRRKRLDNFMQQEGLTPEGLAQQQEQAAARMPNGRMRQEARDRVAGAQAAELRARMARRGMDENEQAAGLRDIGNAGRQRVPQRRGMRSVAPSAENNRTPAGEKTEENTKEVANAGDKMVRAVAQNGQVTLQKFQQIESTMLELSRMLAQNAGGQVGMPGRQFNAGRR
jgi:hypothetical protein